MAITSRDEWYVAADAPPERKRLDPSPYQPHTCPRDGTRPGLFGGFFRLKNPATPYTWVHRHDWGGIRVTRSYDLSLSHSEAGDYIVPWEIARRGKVTSPPMREKSSTT
jgi:hypothetical protein